MTGSRQSVTRQCYATSLRKASRRLTALYDEALAPVGLRSTQHAILAELAHGGPLSIQELARLLVVDRSGLGHTLRPLERDGLLTLRRAAADRRSVEVELTLAGRQRLRDAAPRWRDAQQRITAMLTAPTADRLRGELLTLAEDEQWDSHDDLPAGDHAPARAGGGARREPG